jgi:peptidoglycan-associated lipoprotein
MSTISFLITKFKLTNQEVYMLKNSLILILSLFLLSCQSINTNQDAKEEISKENQAVEEKTVQPYETINSEEQAQALNQQTEAENQEVEVEDRVFFSSNSSSVEESAKKILDLQAQWLKSDESINVTIEGHCDERGTREYNIALGEKRAFAVKKYLKQLGVPEARMKIVSYGKERPAFFGNSDDIHNKNRRAVTVVN